MTWLDDLYAEIKQKQTQPMQDPVTNKVNFREASIASRPQYTQPVISAQDNTNNKNKYQWQTDILGNMKGKGVGRSYADKFTTLTNQLGMSPGQANDFRNFLNFQEDSQQQVKMNKNGTPNQSQNIRMGQGTTTQNSQLDGILNNLQAQNLQMIKDNNKKDYQKAQDAKNAQAQAQNPTGTMNWYDKLNAGAQRIGDQVWRSAFGNNFVDSNDQWQKDLAQQELAANPKDTHAQSALMQLADSTRQPQNGFEKGLNYLGGTVGTVAPYLVGDGVLGAAGEIAPAAKLAMTPSNPIAKLALQGATSGLVGSGIDSATKNALGENLTPQQIAANLALNTVGGGVLNPLAHGVLTNLNLKNQLAKMMEGSGSTKYNEQALQKAVQDAYTPKGNFSNVVADPTPAAPTVPAPFESKYNLPPQTTPTPVDGGKTPELQQTEQDLKKAWDLRQQHEDAHVQDALAPYHEAQTQQAQAEQTFQTTVKNAQETAQRIKQAYGKIAIPKDATGRDIQDQIPAQFRSKKGEVNSKAPVDIHTFAEQEGFSSPEEAVQYLKQLDSDSKLKLKDLTNHDGMKITEDKWNQLDAAARKSFADSPKGQAADELLNHLMGIHKDLTTPKGEINPGTRTLLNSKVVNNSQSPEDILRSLVSNEKPSPKSEPVVNDSTQIKPSTGTEAEQPGGRLRLNLQHFDNEEKPNLISSEKPIESKSAIDSIKNPISRAFHKVYEGTASSTHSMNVVESTVLKDKIARLEKDGGAPKKVEQLKTQLKKVQRSGSDANKALQNEQAAANLSQVFSEKHLKNMQEALGTTSEKTMSDALHYQIAKNVDWIRSEKGGNRPDYSVGKDANGNEVWDQGRVNGLINQAVDNPKLEDFSNAFRGWVKERLDLALKHDQMSKEQHAALLANPHYIPMSRDLTPFMDNVDRGLNGGGVSNKISSNIHFVHSLGQGHADALYKNPLETMIKGDYDLFKNITKTDTLQQMYRLANLNKGASADNVFAKVISKQTYDKNGGLEVPVPGGNGKKAYVQVQPDIMKVMKEATLPQDLDVMGHVTSAIASLKTRSGEFQFTNVIRDLMDGYVKGQGNVNPFKYGKEIVKAALDHNISAKQAGAFFDTASRRSGMGDINQEKLMKEFVRQNKDVKVFSFKNPQGWKDAVSAIHDALSNNKILNIPREIAKLSDELPRSVEINETKRLYMQKHGDQIAKFQDQLGKVNQVLDSVKNSQDPFDPRLQGINKLQAQKDKLESALNQHATNLEREQTFRGRDLMNFNRNGRSNTAKRIRNWVMFAKTTTQAKDKFIRAFIERPGQTLAKTAILTSPFILGEYANHQSMSNDDKTKYDNMPFWFKQNNYVFMHNGNVITIPKQQEISILMNPFENAILGDQQGVNDSLRSAVKETVPLQLGNVAQGLVPNRDGSMTVLKNSTMPGFGAEPFVDVVADKQLGLNQNPISTADFFHRKNAQANKWTMDSFKSMFGNTPRADYAQYLTKSLGGDYGKYGEYGFDWLRDPSNNAKLDALIQNLSPLQDRIYSNNKVSGHNLAKSVPQRSTVTKK